jgi:hypothetical protein
LEDSKDLFQNKKKERSYLRNLNTISLLTSRSDWFGGFRRSFQNKEKKEAAV